MKRFPAVVLPLFATLCLMEGGGGFVRAHAEPPAAATTPEPTPAEEPTPRVNKPLNFSLPLAIGDPASKVRIPQYGDVGQLLSLLNSISVKRLDENRLELQGTDLDLNKPDGKTDFHIRLPKAIFDTRTRILTSLEPVVVSTTDFDLQGERMEFDTGARSGRLLGWVYMKIHNSKSAIGSPEKPSRPAPTPAVSP